MRVLSALFVVAPIVTATCGWAGVAYGDEPPQKAVGNEADAARMFREGEAAYAGGDFTRAAERFERANELVPHHGVLWNAARSWLRAGDDVRAANLLERFLRVAPGEAAERDQATSSLAKLRKRLGCLELRGVGVRDLRVDDARVTAPLHYVAPGEHIATASADGVAVRRVISVAAGERMAVLLTAPAPAPARESPATSVTVEPAVDEGASPASSGLSPWFAIAGAGLTLAAASATVASGLGAQSDQRRFDDLNASPTSTLPERTAAFDDARDAGRRTNVLLGITAGVGALTAVTAAFFVDWQGTSKSTSKSKSGAPQGTVRRHPHRTWSLGVTPTGIVSFHATLP